jgi:phosphatidylinositol alpha 1,6-mannosyltransferase
MPRIALFSDSYDEANGVRRTTLAIETSAKRRNIPVLSVHSCSETRLVHDGSIARLGLKRSSMFSFGLEHNQRFDLSMRRHMTRVAETVEWFAADVLHFIGASDVGLLGASIGRRLSIPMVASWHDDPHEHAQERLPLKLFYKIPCVCGSTSLTSRCVNTDMFTPARRRGSNAIVNIGYVGRLSAQEDVRVLRAVEAELDVEGLDARFTIVGDGSEREWLQQNMLRAEFTGALSGDALADAYAQMDIFAFPCQTDTEGNEVLEAMASGVPTVVMAAGGHRFMAEALRGAIVAETLVAFVEGVRALVKNRQRRVKMGIAARAHAVDLFSWDRIFVDICHTYDAAIAQMPVDAARFTERLRLRVMKAESQRIGRPAPGRI